jgi:plasmid stabilization system protein ParE
VTARYVLAPAAVADIDGIADRLAAIDVDLAFRTIDVIHAACARLAERPHLGHRRPDLTSRPVWFWTVARRYAVIYRKTSPLEVARVVAWRRDVAELLR